MIDYISPLPYQVDDVIIFGNIFLSLIGLWIITSHTLIMKIHYDNFRGKKKVKYT